MPPSDNQKKPNLHLTTLAIHGLDSAASNSSLDVAPPISVTTTFIQDLNTETPYPHVYSRESTPLRVQLESVLGALNRGCAVTYSSGLSATLGALCHYNPKRIVMSKDGYHGIHHVMHVYARGRNLQFVALDSPMQKGDLVWLESPRNPDGRLVSVPEYVRRAKAAGAVVVVDSTFAPPPLQYPLELGCDMVMHSTTKFFGGHSDLLGGLLVARDEKVAAHLREDREALGAVMGSLETWLLLRSARTFPLRVLRQAATAFEVIQWLHQLQVNPRSNKEQRIGKLIKKVHHPSIDATNELKTAWKNGWSPVFSIDLTPPHLARLLPKTLHLFQTATSLGGVESLIDWRYQYDKTISEGLLRISIGLEDPEDLKRDLWTGLEMIADKAAGGNGKLGKL
ncbi:Cys/Met metabolism PLP-dependent enzyme-domain-containing protein [Paraphysoderma sedebokerense]|nr:Cys/Met metabolism PLP-dependent enzyme-domain-containing protein [Paraphysoderma sedebokerense]